MKDSFFRFDEAMFENWQKLLSTEKLFVLFLRISLIHDFGQFLLWNGVVVLKELILNSFYFGRVC